MVLFRPPTYKNTFVGYMHIINSFLKAFKSDNTGIIDPLNRTIANYRQLLHYNLKAIEVKLSRGFRWLWKRSSRVGGPVKGKESSHSPWRKEEWLEYCVAPRPGCILVTLNTLKKVLTGLASAVINKTEHM